MDFPVFEESLKGREGSVLEAVDRRVRGVLSQERMGRAQLLLLVRSMADDDFQPRGRF